MKLKNILLVAVVAFIGMTGNVSASINVDKDGNLTYVDDYKKYNIGDKVTVTIPNTNKTKEFYVGEDYGVLGEPSKCNEFYTEYESGKYISDCDLISLLEVENILDDVMAKDYMTKVNSLYDETSDNFYSKLDKYDVDSKLIIYYPISDFDLSYLCSASIDFSANTEFNCPSWLGSGFWLEDDSLYDEKNPLLWKSSTLNSNGKNLKVSSVKLDSEEKNDVKMSLLIHKSFVDGAKVTSGSTDSGNAVKPEADDKNDTAKPETDDKDTNVDTSDKDTNVGASDKNNTTKPNTNTDKKSETVKNPQTGVSIPALILFVLVIMGTVVVSKINKKDKFHQV